MTAPQDQQSFLIAMCKEQVDHSRHHEVQRQQSTALILSLTAGTAIVESGLLQAALRDAGHDLLGQIMIASHAIFGVLIYVLSRLGLRLSKVHYMRSRQHADKSRAYRALLEKHFPAEFALTELRATQAIETKANDRASKQWERIYGWVTILGLALTFFPIILATFVAFQPQPIPAS